MSHMLSELLQVPEPQFRQGIADLERACGRPSIDVRLQSELIGSRIQVLQELGLDPHDTTAAELSGALRTKLQEAVGQAGDLFQLSEDADAQDAVAAVIRQIDGLAMTKTVWVLRRSIAKQLLKQKPPKKTMAALGYRSLDSMLKREDVGVLYLALRQFESSTWQKQFLSTYRNLHPSDFEQRPVSVVVLPPAIAVPQLILRAKEVGYIGVRVPPITVRSVFALALLMFLLHSIGELRIFSSYAKLQQVNKGFGKLYAELAQSDALHVASVLGRKVHWRSVYRYYAQHDAMLPDFFTPHVQSEDLEWLHIERLLAAKLPALEWWLPYTYTAVVLHGQVVSLNVMDVLHDAVRSVHYGQPSSTYVREALWHELIGRYLAHEHLLSHVLSQIDPQTIAKPMPSVPRHQESWL